MRVLAGFGFLRIAGFIPRGAGVCGRNGRRPGADAPGPGRRLRRLPNAGPPLFARKC